MSFAPLISKGLAALGLCIVNKRLYRKDYFKTESSRLMRPISSEYNTLLDLYPTREDKRKGIDNQILFVEMVHWLGLEKSKPLKILDVGGRGGLFAYFCKQYGHDSYISDIPGVLKQSPNKELLKLLEVNSLDLKIEPFKYIDTRGIKFDLVTGFRTRFHSRLTFETGKNHEEHWGIGEWDFFLQDFSENILTDEGKIFFMLNRLQERDKVDYVPAELAAFFALKGGKLRQQFLYFNHKPVPIKNADD